MLHYDSSLRLAHEVRFIARTSVRSRRICLDRRSDRVAALRGPRGSGRRQCRSTSPIRIVEYCVGLDCPDQSNLGFRVGVTSRVCDYPFEAMLPMVPSHPGVVLADRPRSTSWEKRPIKTCLASTRFALIEVLRTFGCVARNRLNSGPRRGKAAIEPTRTNALPDIAVQHDNPDGPHSPPGYFGGWRARSERAAQLIDPQATAGHTRHCCDQTRSASAVAQSCSARITSFREIMPASRCSLSSTGMLRSRWLTISSSTRVSLVSGAT